MIRTIKSRPYAAEDVQRLQKKLEANDAKRLEILHKFTPPKALYSDKFKPVHKLFALKSDKISLLSEINKAMIIGFRNIAEGKTCPKIEAQKFLEVLA